MAFFWFPPHPELGSQHHWMNKVTPSPILPQDGVSQPFPGSDTLWEACTNGLNFFPFEFTVLSM